MTKPDRCPGCGAALPPESGPIHAYMLSSPACWARYNRILAAEYSDPGVWAVHRLSVDAFAVQHPGLPTDRRAVQSVAVHLGRLKLQIEDDVTETEANARMVRFMRFKGTVPTIVSPRDFTITTADVAPHAGTDRHVEKVREWAWATWDDYASQQKTIRDWVATTLGRDGRG